MNPPLNSNDMTADDDAGSSPWVRTWVDVRGSAQTGRQPDKVAEEVPVALVYNGISHAVMMATPMDLADFALGFSLTEGILSRPSELFSLEIQESLDGISVDMHIAGGPMTRLKARRRSMAGRTGCGLCGTESLAEAIRPLPPVGPHPVISDSAIQRAIRELKTHQPLQHATGATHGAAWCDRDGNILATREDVGRHNALDKLIGCWLGNHGDFGPGFALISSRASFEMVQKSASVGIGCLVAVSAPTALAIREAGKTAMMLVGFARPGRHVIYRDANAPRFEESPQETGP